MGRRGLALKLKQAARGYVCIACGAPRVRPGGPGGKCRQCSLGKSPGDIVAGARLVRGKAQGSSE
jgi:hypothetical protein